LGIEGRKSVTGPYTMGTKGFFQTDYLRNVEGLFM